MSTTEQTTQQTQQTKPVEPATTPPEAPAPQPEQPPRKYAGKYASPEELAKGVSELRSSMGKPPVDLSGVPVEVAEELYTALLRERGSKPQLKLGAEPAASKVAEEKLAKMNFVELMQAAGFDAEYAQHVATSDESLPPEAYAKLAQVNPSLNKIAVDASRSRDRTRLEASKAMLDVAVASVYAKYGGEDEVKSVLKQAGNVLDSGEQASFQEMLKDPSRMETAYRMVRDIVKSRAPQGSTPIPTMAATGSGNVSAKRVSELLSKLNDRDLSVRAKAAEEFKKLTPDQIAKAYQQGN